MNQENKKCEHSSSKTTKQTTITEWECLICKENYKTVSENPNAESNTALKDFDNIFPEFLEMSNYMVFRNVCDRNKVKHFMQQFLLKQIEDFSDKLKQTRQEVIDECIKEIKKENEWAKPMKEEEVNWKIHYMGYNEAIKNILCQLNKLK